MLLWLLALPLPALASLDKTLGVAPALLSKYTPPKSGVWKCLDGSKEIPWDFVNDDACDCPDGSDEPGRTHNQNVTRRCLPDSMFIPKAPARARTAHSTAKTPATLARPFRAPG